MASRNGPRVGGTDGNDFLHRETVAPHYKSSATYKGRIKAICGLHFAIGVIMLLRLSTYICVTAGIRPPSFLQKLRMPVLDGWEIPWLVSVIAPVFALIATRRNKAFLMKQYVLGILIFGMLPIAYGIFDNLDDLMQYWESKTTTRLFLGFPWVVLEHMFFVICVQLHGFGLYFAFQLIRAWQPRIVKKSQ